MRDIQRPLTGNMLKWIAAICMVIDHVGFMFYPHLTVLRIIGRLSFPIFCFMIAEGCRYTKNKLRYFLTIFLLASGCQVVYYLFDHSLYMCVLVTFSLAILVIYAMQYAKDACFSPTAPAAIKGLAVLTLLTALLLLRLANEWLTVDYGFWGCLVPVFAALPQAPRQHAPGWWQKVDTVPVRVLSLGVGLLLLAWSFGDIQIYSLLAVPLLLLYSGKRGRARMKYFFYVFYPLHLALLEGLYLLWH